MSAIRHPIVARDDSGEDIVLDVWASRSAFEEDASLNYGESPSRYFAERYDWSILARLEPDRELADRYAGIRAPRYPWLHDDGEGD